MAVSIKSPLLMMRIYDRSVNQVTDIYDFTSLSLSIGINQSGACRLTLPQGHFANSVIGTRYLCEVHLAHRRATGDTWIFAGELERVSRKVDGGRKQYIYTFAGVLSVLQQSIVAWKAGTDNRSSFTGEDIHDIIDNVITYNHFFGTTGAGRERTSDNDHVQFIEYSSPSSPVNIDYGCAWRNVYDAVIELADAAGYEFEVELDKAFNRVLYSLDYDKLGTSQTATTIFSEELGTVLSYEIVTERSDFKTVAIIGGGGQEDNRTIEVVENAYYTSASKNAELFVDQRQTSDSGHLEAAGEAALAQSKGRARYTIKLSRQYINRFHPNRSDLWLGDTIRFTMDGTNLAYRIIGMQFSAESGRTDISLVIEE